MLMRRTTLFRSKKALRTYTTDQTNPYAALTYVFPPRSTDGQTQGPLSGLIYTAKENICTTEGPTTCASSILGAASGIPYQSPFNAACIDLLSAAGARLNAKTNMDEFGMGSFNTNTPYDTVLNPHDTECSAGGSSGGAAASLFQPTSASQESINFSIGTDTGGSIRTPASYCGVYGFKPSYGRISRLGLIPYANSLDTIGIMARNQPDAIDVLQKVYRVLNKWDHRDSTSLSLATRDKITRQTLNVSSKDIIRIGVPNEYHVGELSPAILEAWKDALVHMTESSTQPIEIVPITLSLTRSSLAAYYVLSLAEASSNLQKYSGIFYGPRADEDAPDGRLYSGTRDLFGLETKKRILMGCMSLSAEAYDNYYLQAQRIRSMVIQEFNSILALDHPLLPAKKTGTIDYIVTPVSPFVAPRLESIARMSTVESYAADVMTVPASLAGLPALSIPFTTDSDGMPIGIQLMGQYGADEGVLRLARAFL